MTALEQRLQQIDRLRGQAQVIDFRVDRLDEQFRQAFPTSFEHLARRDSRIAAAKQRPESEMAAFRQTMGVQRGIVEKVRDDAEELKTNRTEELSVGKKVSVSVDSGCRRYLKKNKIKQASTKI